MIVYEDGYAVLTHDDPLERMVVLQRLASEQALTARHLAEVLDSKLAAQWTQNTWRTITAIQRRSAVLYGLARLEHQVCYGELL